MPTPLTPSNNSVTHCNTICQGTLGWLDCEDQNYAIDIRAAATEPSRTLFTQTADWIIVAYLMLPYPLTSGAREGENLGKVCSKDTHGHVPRLRLEDSLRIDRDGDVVPHDHPATIEGIVPADAKVVTIDPCCGEKPRARLWPPVYPVLPP